MVTANTVDVIVPVWNQFDVTKQCIESVIASASRNDFEIVVVDDASSDPALVAYLRTLAKAGAIRLFTNKFNIGFTATVNFGMGIDPERDVLLLNSDTVVNGAWLERMRAAAYSDRQVATVNPLTNASHRSGYPYRHSNRGVALEVSDNVLDELAAERNAGIYAEVPTTVGFCMYIKRQCLNDIGLFDVDHFPVGYGEESDFCYRARKVGWRHLVVGDVFVRHLDSQSFGKRKRKLVRHMVSKFAVLHPNSPQVDERFRRLDPLHALRAGLDLARLRRLVEPCKAIRMNMVENWNGPIDANDPTVLVYCLQEHSVQLVVAKEHFPNLQQYKMPRDIIEFNGAIRYLGIEKIVCRSESDLATLDRRVMAMPIEVGLEPRLEVAQAS